MSDTETTRNHSHHVLPLPERRFLSRSVHMAIACDGDGDDDDDEEMY